MPVHNDPDQDKVDAAILKRTRDTKGKPVPLP